MVQGEGVATKAIFFTRCDLHFIVLFRGMNGEVINELTKLKRKEQQSRRRFVIHPVAVCNCLLILINVIEL